MPGKIVAIVVTVAILVGGSFYLGQKFGTSKPSSTVVSNSPTTSDTPAPTPSPTVSPSPSPSRQSSQNIQAGGFGSYGKYAITIPASWKVEKTQKNSQDLLTLSNGEYQLQVNQLNGGASPCTYPGDNQTPMSESFTSYITLGTTPDPNLYRRGKSQIPYPNGEDQYIVCQKFPDGTYDTNTTFGSIYYIAPKNPDLSILAQMDTIIQSLKTQ